MSMFVLGSYVNANCLSVNHLPQMGESLVAENIQIEHGGKGLNVALAAHRLGVEVDLVLAIGDDPAGNALLSFLGQEGIATDWVQKTAAHSGYGVGFIDPTGNNFLAVYPGANTLLSAKQVLTALMAKENVALVYAQFEIPMATILAAFEYAHRQGISTFLNSSPWHPINPALLVVTDILVVNVSEAGQLFNLADYSAWAVTDWVAALPTLVSAIGWQGRLLVVTLAELGCVAFIDNQVFQVPAYQVTMVDATGAGDAFNGGLAMGLTAQKTVSDALILANACGAWVASRNGVLGALPTIRDISGWLAKPVVISQTAI